MAKEIEAAKDGEIDMIRERATRSLALISRIDKLRAEKEELVALLREAQEYVRQVSKAPGHPVFALLARIEAKLGEGK